MILDERIKTVRNRAAAGGFFITFCLLLIDLNYRVYYLKQAPGDYWDIFMIWFASTLYAGITMFSSGMMSGRTQVFIREFKILIACAIVLALVTLYFQGRITSLHDFAEIMLGLIVFALAFFSVIFFYNYLNRRWEKKNELDE